MSGSITSQTAAQTAAAATAAAASGATASGAAASGAATTGSSALSGLSGNFSTFLQLLMTQLKNQDPTSPLDTNQFTTELVQFTGVEQQINTNTSLGQLIQLTQGGEVVQSAALLGKQVQVADHDLSLQNGAAKIGFTAPTAGTAQIVVTDAKGNQLATANVATTGGANTWTWNGATQGGGQAADGAYSVAVTSTNADGSSATLPYTVIGTATGVVTDGSIVQLQLGGLTVPFSEVRSVTAPPS